MSSEPPPFDDIDIDNTDTRQRRGSKEQTAHSAANGRDPDHQLPVIEWIDERLSDWADRDIPDRLWVWEEWIPRDQCTGLYGSGGVNKTDLLIQLGLAKSRGLVFLGIPLEAGPVYALFLEDTREEVLRRATRIAKEAWGFTSLAGFPNYHFASLVGFDDPEFVSFDGPNMQIKQALFRVDQKIMQIGAHLCTLDTLPHFFGGNEIVRREVSRFIRRLDGNSIARQCAYVASAHPSARGRQTGSMESGSTGWEGGFRSRIGLHDPGLEGDDEDKQAPKIASDRRVLTRLKSNYAKQGETIDLVWRDGTFFVTAVGPEAANRPPRSGPGRHAAGEAKFLELLAAVDDEGSHVSESVHSGRYAPKVFAKRPSRGDFREAEFNRAMIRLFEAKRIKVIGFGPKSKDQRKIIDLQAEPDPEPEATPDPAREPTPPTEVEIKAEIARHLTVPETLRDADARATAKKLGMLVGTFRKLAKAAETQPQAAEAPPPIETAENGGNPPESGVSDE